MIVAKALRAMAVAVRPGVTTAELSEIGAKVLALHGARSSPPMVYGFPGDGVHQRERRSGATAFPADAVLHAATSSNST